MALEVTSSPALLKSVGHPDHRRLFPRSSIFHRSQRVQPGVRGLQHARASMEMRLTPPSPGPLFGEQTSSSRGMAAHAAVAEAQVQGVAPAEDSKVEESSAASQQEKKFVWEQAWYPVGIVQDFDKKIPAPVTILGLPMVVWWDKNYGSEGGWRVFYDLCPHRFAPLSEGRIHESGDVQCSYHGWTFKGDGTCTMIPQADPDRPDPCSNRKACARPYPAKVHQGILWVWPQLGLEAAALADATTIPTVPQQSDPAFSVSMGQCELGYSYEFLVENLADPAHVPFAHHKIMGNRSNAGPLDNAVKDITVEGITGDGGRFRNFSFQPPSLLHSVIVFPSKDAAKKSTEPGKAGSYRVVTEESSSEPVKDRQLSMAFYCIPHSPGRCRVIFAFSFNFLPPVAKLIPRWYNHIGQMLVLDSDHYFLHLLERRLLREGGQRKALSAYYTPTKSDAYVLAYRKWLDEFAGGGVQWPKGVDPQLPPAPTKRELMDRQRNHIQICKTCRDAQGWLEKLQFALQAASFVVLAVTALQAALRPSWFSGTVAVASVVLSLALAAAGAWMSRWLSRTYHFLDYVHALVD